MDYFHKNSNSITLLKLGGSLITEKAHPRTLRPDTLTRLTDEISSVLQEQPSMPLIIGHGAGSFAHVSADHHNTRQGVRTPAQWRGFTEVWWDASTLNRLVMKALLEAGLPAISLPPSASVIAQDGQVINWDLGPLKSAISAGLLPVIYGDVIFDTRRGGTILSTEDLFGHLARQFQSRRMLLAGIEPGVWEDYPTCSRVIPKITPDNLEDIAPALGGSEATDVTGGMESKVKQCLDLTQDIPELEIEIFSGDEPGTLIDVLHGVHRGTMIVRR
ncbi:isopentenyl phosphate kinase [Chloroflexota bacterium]